MNPQLSATSRAGIRNRTGTSGDCATPSPLLVRVQDPFGSLLAKAKGSVLIGAKQVMDAAADRG